MRVTGEWELNPAEVAAIFKAKGWVTSTRERGLTIPTEEDIDHILVQLIRQVVTEDRDQAQRARFLICKDPDLEGSFDLWLNLGFIWDEDTPLADVN